VGGRSQQHHDSASPLRVCRTSRKRRHLTGVGRSAVPAGGDLPAPDVIADVSADTPLTACAHTAYADAHTRQVEAAEVEPCNLPARDGRGVRLARRGVSGSVAIATALAPWRSRRAAQRPATRCSTQALSTLISSATTRSRAGVARRPSVTPTRPTHQAPHWRDTQPADHRFTESLRRRAAATRGCDPVPGRFALESAPRRFLLFHQTATATRVDPRRLARYALRQAVRPTGQHLGRKAKHPSSA
jgi:hypothetical protein